MLQGSGLAHANGAAMAQSAGLCRLRCHCAAFLATARHYWAWVAIVALWLLAVSFALTTRAEYKGRLALEQRPQQERRAHTQQLLARAIADGHAIMDMTDVMNMGIQWERWRPETWEMLREHFGLAQAQDFFDAAEMGEHPNRLQVPAYVEAQVEFLEALHASPNA